MSLFEEASELVRTGKIWLVDEETGEAKDFPVDKYAVIAGLIRSGRFIPKMSEKAAAAHVVTVLARLGRKN